jgi:hypothetical protein
MIAAFLVRCSTNKQDYDRQLKDLTKVANRFNFKVDPKFIFGEYITGKDDTTKGDRKSIRRLREAAEEKKFDVILVNEVNRMSRDSVSGRVYIRQLNNIGIPVYFRDRDKWTIDINTRIVDTGFEKELGSFFDGAAEYLRSLKTQTASGRRKRLEDNQMVQGLPAYGYTKFGGKDKSTKNTIIIDPETYQIVIDIYSKYLEEGSTLKSTSLAISTKYNKKFSVGKINHILNYSGYYSGQTKVNVKDPDRNNEIETFIITFDPIIEEETFIKVRKKLSANRSSVKPHNTKQKVHLLSRIIKCSFCGHSFTPRKRNDNRTAHNWLCMSRINNSSECDSHINLNGEKMDSLVWNLIKKELIIYTDINIEERELRITKEKEGIAKFKEDSEDLLNNIEVQKKKQIRAYNAYINVPDGAEEIALEMYNKTLSETKKEVNYLEGRILTLNKLIKDSTDKITRYSQTDYTESYIKEIESDFNKKRSLFIEYIKAVYPYKVGYRIVILEVHTVEGIYNILLNANQRNHKEAYYISNSFALWQNSINKYAAYDSGDYFLVTNPNMVMESEELEEMVTYDEMTNICKNNDWTLKY